MCAHAPGDIISELSVQVVGPCDYSKCLPYFVHNFVWRSFSMKDELFIVIICIILCFLSRIF